MEDKVLLECSELMDHCIKRLEKELSRVRTGRASTNLLDGIRVDYYGTPTPLAQVASLSVPDARTKTLPLPGLLPTLPSTSCST